MLRHVAIFVENLLANMFFLVGGFNPFEKYQSNWKSSPNREENNKYLKPPVFVVLTCFLLSKKNMFSRVGDARTYMASKLPG